MLEEVSKPRTPVLGNAQTVYDWSKARLVPLDHEEIWVLALDGRHQLRAAKMVARGGLSHVQLTTHDVLRFVLREGAVAFVLAHNHPSGDPEPSREDLEFTRAIVEAGKNAGVPCIDHVIVARGGYTSLLERNMMPIAS
jgi:DNA repair protein RadC